MARNPLRTAQSVVGFSSHTAHKAQWKQTIVDLTGMEFMFRGKQQKNG